jgi:hypothetical protein
MGCPAQDRPPIASDVGWHLLGPDGTGAQIPDNSNGYQC